MGHLHLEESLGGHHIFANFKTDNKSRTVAIIIHMRWSIHHVYRDPTGSLIGVVASRNGIEILLVSAYLPAKLDLFGYPEIWEEDKN